MMSRSIHSGHCEFREGAIPQEKALPKKRSARYYACKRYARLIMGPTFPDESPAVARPILTDSSARDTMSPGCDNGLPTKASRFHYSDPTFLDVTKYAVSCSLFRLRQACFADDHRDEAFSLRHAVARVIVSPRAPSFFPSPICASLNQTWDMIISEPGVI